MWASDCLCKPFTDCSVSMRIQTLGMQLQDVMFTLLVLLLLWSELSQLLSEFCMEESESLLFAVLSQGSKLELQNRERSIKIRRILSNELSAFELR